MATDATPVPDVDTTPRLPYLVFTALLVLVSGILGPIIRGNTDVTFVVKDGVEAFAILFVIATALERLNVILVPMFDWLLGKIAGGTASKIKSDSLSTIRLTRLSLASSAEGDAADKAKTVDDGAKKVTRSNVEKALLTTSIAFTVGILGMALLKFSLLGSIGYEHVPVWVDVLVTAAAISGGAAGLGDLISKVQKTKTNAETSTAG